LGSTQESRACFFQLYVGCTKNAKYDDDDDDADDDDDDDDDDIYYKMYYWQHSHLFFAL
jgi:hypothetical protein